MEFKPTTYGSLFTGVGGFEIGLSHLDWEPRWLCELDLYARDILQYHFDVPVYENILELKGNTLPVVDVIVGGFPCQSFSTGGARDGSGLELFDEMVRIVREMREETDGEYPKAVIWENVINILSNGEWMSHIYSAWAEAGAMEQEHRVIDTLDFGVPQRRTRVIGVVSFSDTASGPDGILSLSPSISGDFGSGHGSASGTLGSAGEQPYSITPKSGQGKILTARKVNFANTITHIDAPDRGTFIIQNNLVRRLTPIEKERLMGWPDDHTKYGIYGEIPYTQRIKMIGNGIHAEMARWAGSCISEILGEK